MTTITMPRSFDQALQEVAGEAMLSVTKALAEKYGFDPEEAVRGLELEELKIVKKRGPIPKAKGAKKAAKADGEKSKRRTTGYLMFSAATRPEVKAEMADALEDDEKLAPQEVVRELASRWKALEDEERQAWNQRALEEGSDSGEEAKPKPAKKPKAPKAPKEPKAPKAKAAKPPPPPPKKAVQVLLSDSEDSDASSDEDDEM